MKIINLPYLLVYILCHAFVLLSAAGEKNGQKPNIIFIFADDMGFGDLGCYGNPTIKTPHLDNLSSEGTLFTNFTVASPVCSPSRTGIMTGQYPARHRIHYALSNNKEHNGQFKMPDYLDPETTTLTALLKSAGYTTAHFGKWHLGSTEDAPNPHQYGIDEIRIDGDNLQNPEERIYSGISDAKKTERLIDITIDFIERHQNNKPFYINCWLKDPHGILAPDQEQLAEYPELESRASGFTGTTQVYNAVITNIDKQIGRLLQKLEEMGLAENTLIVFSSDNGPAPIWGIGTAHSGAGATGPLRGCKASIYEGGIRVPFIIRWPGKIPAGRIDDSTVISGVDLLPTFCAIAGADYQKKIKADGEDMTRAFMGESVNRKNPLMWQYRFGPWGRHLQKSPVLAMRDGVWKLMMNPDKTRIELYNLKENPCEVDNLASEHPEVVKGMSEKLLQWHLALPDVESMPPSAGSFEYPWPGKK